MCESWGTPEAGSDCDPTPLRVGATEGGDRYDRNNNWRESFEQLGNSRDHRDLEGTWYLNGDRRRPGEIVSSRGGQLEAVNDRGKRSRLDVDRHGDVRAINWERGLRGKVRRDRIEWENGTTWTREPHTRSDSRR